MGVSEVEGGGPLVHVGVVAQSAFKGDVECNALVHHTHMANERVVFRVRQPALGAGEADLRRVYDGEFSHVALRDTGGRACRRNVIRLWSMASGGGPSIQWYPSASGSGPSIRW